MFNLTKRRKMNTLKKENQPKVDLQKTTWTSVQDVAKSEKQANGIH